jgi:hypothetical protein
MEELEVGVYEEVFFWVAVCQKDKRIPVIQDSLGIKNNFPPGGNYKGVTNFRLLMNCTIENLVLPLGFWNFPKNAQKVSGFYKIPR